MIVLQEQMRQTFQTRRALLRSLVPCYQQASPAQKTLLLDAFVAWTGYTRTSAIKQFNQEQLGQLTMRRPRSPRSGPEVQQALFVARRVARSICAKRLLPVLPPLLPSRERKGHRWFNEQ